MLKTQSLGNDEQHSAPLCS